jgi:hypothetical protein
MATEDTASVVPLHQPRPKTSAERNKAFRERQKERSAARKSAKPAQLLKSLERSRSAIPRSRSWKRQRPN